MNSSTRALLLSIFMLIALITTACKNDGVPVLPVPVTSAIPEAPTALTATVDGTSPTSTINLAWTDASLTEQEFKIERSTDNTTFTALATVTTNIVIYVDNTCVDNTTYYYRVAASNLIGDSAFSNVASEMTDLAGPLTPAAPTSLTATRSTVNAATTIDLAWTDNATNETGVKIERSSDNITFAQVALAGANATTFSDSTLTYGTTYYYKIRTTNASGDSSYTTVATASTGGPCSNTVTIGAVCASGGIYAGTYGGSTYMTTGSHCLTNVVTPTCDENPVASSRVTDTLTSAWGNNGVTTGATSSTDGVANTAAAIAGDSGGADAANFCQNMVYAGFSDWFLGARLEMDSVLYANRVALGGFTTASVYFTSSESSGNRAYAESFNDGSFPTPNKYSQGYVRCIRKF